MKNALDFVSAPSYRKTGCSEISHEGFHDLSNYSGVVLLMTELTHMRPCHSQSTTWHVIKSDAPSSSSWWEGSERSLAISLKNTLSFKWLEVGSLLYACFAAWKSVRLMKRAHSASLSTRIQISTSSWKDLVWCIWCICWCIWIMLRLLLTD